MGREIERKFLVKDGRWRSLGTGTAYCQGYIATENPEKTVRVRVAGDRGYLTLKGKTRGRGRAEFEYAIPLEEAQTMLATLCDRPLIEKVRYVIPQGDVVWEVDEFAGENEGLILAEVELKEEDQVIELPDWIGEEVTEDLRYYNANLRKNPYQKWR